MFIPCPCRSTDSLKFSGWPISILCVQAIARCNIPLKLSKGANAPKPAPAYKPLLLGNEQLDSRGHLPLDAFLKLAIEAAAQQRKRDANLLDAIYNSYAKGAAGGRSLHTHDAHTHTRTHTRTGMLARAGPTGAPSTPSPR